MPSIQITIEKTAEDTAVFLVWFNRYNTKLNTPHANVGAYLTWVLSDHFDSVVKSEDNFENLLQRWQSMTKDQHDRVKAIFNEVP